MSDALEPGQHPPRFNAAANPPKAQPQAPAPSLTLTPGGALEQAVHTDVARQEAANASQSQGVPLSPPTAEAFARMMKQKRTQSQSQGMGGQSL